MRKFCVISADYENYVPRSQMPSEEYESHLYKNGDNSIQLGLKSLADQTFKDFNLVLCHDGPKSKTYLEEGIDIEGMGLNATVLNTPQRTNDYGHSSRDLAMKYAYENNLGEYYIQFNVDNQFFPDAFEQINRAIEENGEQILIFPVHHWKACAGDVFPGVPPILNYIDAMQLVAHRDIWKGINFWHDKSMASDGIMYQEMCENNNWKHVPICVGHNF